MSDGTHADGPPGGQGNEQPVVVEREGAGAQEPEHGRGQRDELEEHEQVETEEQAAAGHERHRHAEGARPVAAGPGEETREPAQDEQRDEGGLVHRAEGEGGGHEQEEDERAEVRARWGP